MRIYGCTNYLPIFSLYRGKKGACSLSHFWLLADINLILVQVTNTPWGERVTFLFNPNSDLVAKPLHVSPFMVSYHQLLCIFGNNCLIAATVIITAFFFHFLVIFAL